MAQFGLPQPVGCGALGTTGVADDCALAELTEFVAVTLTRSVLPAVALGTMYVVDVAPEIAPQVPPTLAELTSDGTGTRLEMRADSLEWVAGVLAGLGADFWVIRPNELREQLAQLASRLLLSSHA